MAPLIILIVATLLARLAGQLGFRGLHHWAAAVRAGLAVMFFFTAIAHFNDMRPDLIRMVPPWVSAPEFMVTFTGVCEILGGVGLLVPRTRRMAAVALIVFLIAVLPANLYAAMIGGTIGGEPVTPLLPRIALQVLFVALVWWSGIRQGRPTRFQTLKLFKTF